MSNEQHPPERWRILVVAAVFVSCLGLVAVVFWREDLRYTLPTPRPTDLREIALGTEVPAARWLAEAGISRQLVARPTLLHFFNPGCSCSRFNLEHLGALQRRFRAQVSFVAVVQSIDPESADPRATRRILGELGIDMPFLLDVDGLIARDSGIYATPQALLLDGADRIVYRGNYNTARYCTDRRTEFVRIAIETLLSKHPATVPETPAYGCELPSYEARSRQRSALLRALP